MKALYIATAMTILTGCSATSPVSVNTAPGEPSNLTVEIENVSHNEGQLLVLLFDNAYDYHSDKNINAPDAHFFRKAVIKPQVPVTRITLDNVPAGQYAMHVIHDEDADGGLDRMIIPFTGMPSEPYALSNNIHDSFSKGDFDDALFTVSAPDTKLNLLLSTHLSKMAGF